MYRTRWVGGRFTEFFIRALAGPLLGWARRIPLPESSPLDSMPSPPLDSDAARLRSFSIRALEEVAPLIRAGFGQSGALRFKRGHEAITAVDLEVEDRLRERISSAFPDHAVVGEEKGRTGPEDAATVWAVDPIDGTLNYALGIPLFSTTVAAIREGRVVAGAVLDPLSGACYSAARGEGAWRGEEPLEVSRRSPAREAIVSTQSSRRGRFVRDREIFVAVQQAFMKTRRLGSIAYELALVAAGTLDALLASKEEAQNLYDVAAGMLLVEEAGGRITNGRGGPFAEGDQELVATNGSLHPEVLDLVQASSEVDRGGRSGEGASGNREEQ